MSPPPPPPIVPPIFLFGPPVLPSDPAPEPTPVEATVQTPSVQSPSAAAPAPAPQPEPTHQPSPAPQPVATPQPTAAPPPPATSSWDDIETTPLDTGGIDFDESDLTPSASSESPPAAPNAAAAAILSPGTRRFFFEFGVSRSFKLDTKTDGGAGGFYDYTGGYLASYFGLIGDNPPTSLRFEQAFGAHFKPGTSAGGAVALVFQQNVRMLNDYAFGVRLGHDIQITPNHGVYLSPSALMGFNLARETFEDDYVDYGEVPQDNVLSYNRATFQLAVAAKILLGDRMFFHFRPIDLDIVTNFSEYEVRWSVNGGLGITM